MGRITAALRPGLAWASSAVRQVPERAIGRPAAGLAVAAAVVVVGAVGAAQLRPSASPELLSAPDSPIGRATAQQQRAFGGEPIFIAVKGAVATQILGSEKLLGLLKLEGEVAKLRGVRAVFGPGTFVNQTVLQVERLIERELGPLTQTANRAADAARRRAEAEGKSPAEVKRIVESTRLTTLTSLPAVKDLLVRFGYVGLPAINNRNFTTALALGTGTQPKQRFRFLFPDNEHAVIAVRPQPGLSDAQLRRLGRELESRAKAAGLGRLKLQVAGVPLIAAGVSGAMATELAILAPVVVLGMILALLGALRMRREGLRALVLAGAAMVISAGLAWLLGLGLNPATLAALPVVLGLAVDFAVQLQARFWAFRARRLEPRASALLATRAMAPVLSLAALAMSAGFLTLTLGPVPLIDRLGQTLALGTLVSLSLVLGLGGALFAAGRPGAQRTPALRIPGRVRRMLAGHGRLILAAAAGLAAVGIALSPVMAVESDVAELAPAGMHELRQAEQLQRELGTTGQLRVLVRAPDVTDPQVLAWMARFQRQVLALRRDLRPGPNLAELLLAGLGDRTPTRQEIDGLLTVVPQYFLSGVVTRDRREAELSFGVPLIPVSEQAELLGRIEGLLALAPPQVNAAPAGLLAGAADSVRELEGQRPWLLLAAALVVFLILWRARRSRLRAALPLVPALLAAGISALLLLIVGLRLSPLSAALEPLVLAIGVEFGILLEARYREARQAGEPPAAARAEALERVGGAVAVSAATVAVGFAALAASRMPMLREFGLLVAFELALCLLASVLVVPALAEALDRRALRTAAGLAPERHPRRGRPARADRLPPVRVQRPRARRRAWRRPRAGDRGVHTPDLTGRPR